MISISSWLLFFLVNGFAIYSSWCLSGRLLRGESLLAPKLVATGVVWFAHITVVVLLLGVLVKALNVYSVAIASLVLSAALLGFSWRSRPVFAQPARQALAEIFAPRDYLLFLIVAMFVLQVLVMLAKVVLLPPHVWDVFYYHLTPAVEWYQQGHIPSSIDTPARHMNNVPLGMTVLSYWFFIFLRHDALVELPMFLWALMLVPLSYAILRKSDVGPAWSLKFAVVIFFVPIVLMQGVTSKDHLGLNIAFLAGLFFLAGFLQDRRPGQLIVAALAFGLMLGYKQAAPGFIGVAAVLFFVLLYLNQREVLLDRAQRTTFLKVGAGSAVLMLAVGGYWYVKKILTSGRLGALPPPRPASGGAGEAVAHSRFGLDSLFTNLGEFFPRILDYQSAYGADLPGISGFGPQFAAFGLLALVAAFIALFHRSEYRRPFFLIMASTVILFVLFLVSRYSNNPNSYRILSFLPMAMIAYGAILLHRNGLLASRGGGIVVNLLIGGSIIWNLYFILPPAYTNPALVREYVSMDDDYRTTGTYTRWFIVHRPSLYRLLAVMPPGEKVGIVSPPLFDEVFRKGQQETWSYPYYDRNWRRELVYFDEEGSLQCSKQLRCAASPELKQRLASTGVRLVSTCPTNRCVKMTDPDFFELTPGLYFFRGGS